MAINRWYHADDTTKLDETPLVYDGMAWHPDYDGRIDYSAEMEPTGETTTLRGWPDEGLAIVCRFWRRGEAILPALPAVIDILAYDAKLEDWEDGRKMLVISWDRINRAADALGWEEPTPEPSIPWIADRLGIAPADLYQRLGQATYGLDLDADEHGTVDENAEYVPVRTRDDDDEISAYEADALRENPHA